MIVGDDIGTFLRGRGKKGNNEKYGHEKQLPDIRKESRDR
jgi:hypothetical protein